MATTPGNSDAPPPGPDATSVPFHDDPLSLLFGENEMEMGVLGDDPQSPKSPHEINNTIVGDGVLHNLPVDEEDYYKYESSRSYVDVGEASSASLDVPRRSCGDVFNDLFCKGIPDTFPHRKRVNIWLSKTKGGIIYDVFITSLSLLACLLYIIQTYQPENWYGLGFVVMDLVLTGIFAIDYCIRWYAAESRFWYPFTPYAVIDAVTIIPVWVELIINRTTESSVQLSFLRVIRIIRIYKLLQAFSLLKTNTSVIKREIAFMILSIFCMLFVFAGIFYVVEGEQFENITGATRADYGEEEVTFGVAIYFMIVSATTVGFGDIYPITTPGRVVISVAIISSFMMIPFQLNRIVELVSLRSRFRVKYTCKDTRHVIVCGCVDDIGLLKTFFAEFLHPDRYAVLDIPSRDRDVVVVSPHEPSEELSDFLMSPSLEGRVMYIKASVMNETDLLRIGADRAEACFILCDKFAEDSTLEDCRNIMRTLSIENICPELRTFVQLNDSGNGSFFRETSVGALVCLEEFRMRALAYGACFVGANTLLYNLLRSNSQEDDSTQGGKYHRDWQDDYRNGTSFELYAVDFPKRMFRGDGIRFLKACCDIYDASAGTVFLIGIIQDNIDDFEAYTSSYRSRGSESPNTSMRTPTSPKPQPFSSFGLENRSVLLSPDSGTRIMGGDKAVVMAQSVSIANHVSEDDWYTEKSFTMYEDCVRKTSMTKPDTTDINTDRFKTLNRNVKFKSEGGTVSHPAPVRSTNSMRALRNPLDITSVDDTVIRVNGPDELFLAPPLNTSSPPKFTRLASMPYEDALLEKEIEEHFILKDPSSVKDHIIVLCSNTKGLRIFIRSLRAEILQVKTRTIVIVLPKKVVNEQLEEITTLGEEYCSLFFVGGDKKDVRALKQAGIKTALCLVVLNNGGDVTTVDGESVDSHALFSYLSLDKLNKRYKRPGFREIIECMSPSNMYIMNRKWDTDREEARTQKARRRSASKKALLPQSFQASLMHSQWKRERKRRYRASKESMKQKGVLFEYEEGYHELPIYVSGAGCTKLEFDPLICQAYYQPALIRVAQELLNPAAPERAKVGKSWSASKLGNTGRLVQVSLPKQLEGRTFRSVFRYYLAYYECVVVGLYRFDAVVPFVQTGPPPETIVQSSDLAYVIGPYSIVMEMLRKQYENESKQSDA